MAYRTGIKNPEFKQGYRKFLDLIQEILVNKETGTFYKFGDGDYYFLNKISVGSAKPGSRALSKNYSEINIDEFRFRSSGCNYYFCEIPDHNRDLFYKTFGDTLIHSPAEYIYASIANRDLFRIISQTKSKVGLIGANQKLLLIKELIEYSEYQEYLGITQFDQYIPIPQKFACDDPEQILQDINSLIEKNKCDIYLLGVGHIKSYILSELGKKWNSVFLDVGSGIDALAGVIDTRRPYFGKWRNFTLPNSEAYELIDYLQFNHRNKRKLMER